MEEKQNSYEPPQQEKGEEKDSVWTRPLTVWSCLLWLLALPVLVLLAQFVLFWVTCGAIAGYSVWTA